LNVTYKTADQCTYTQMVDRFRREIRHAVVEGYDSDFIERAQMNLGKFIEKYHGMPESMTIGEYDRMERIP
jgi:hypothetical protein